MTIQKFDVYRGYEGSAQISVTDSVLHGKVLGISDLVTYEGDTVRGLHLAFKDAVDDYIKTCEQLMAGGQ